MASITLAQRNELIALSVAMLNAAPGSDNLSMAVIMLEQGKTLFDIAAYVAGTDFYRKVYPPSLTPDDFAGKLTSILVDKDANATAVSYAKDWIKAKIDAGLSQSAIIATAVKELLASSNADFSASKTQLVNKVDVASYYSVTKAASSNSLDILQYVIADVTSNQNTVVTSKTAIEDVSALPTGRTYILTTGADSIMGGDGKSNDGVIAKLNFQGVTTLTSNDVIDGGGGSNTLQIYGATAGGDMLPSPLTITNVQSVAHTTVTNVGRSSASLYDATGIGGLVSLIVTSLGFGTDYIKASSITSVTSISAGAGCYIVGGNLINITTKGDVFVSGSAGRIMIDVSQAVNFITINVPANNGLTIGVPKNFTSPPKAVDVSATGSLAAALDLAAADGPNTLAWFQYAGNTYLVEDSSYAGQLVATDHVIKLVGLVDVSHVVSNFPLFTTL